MLAEPAPVRRAARKVVTLLFSDVIGSTALGERLDPESLTVVMARYFGAMRPVVEANGGTVAKFIGDAVMAVFGVPAVHEDDALRAVRAAHEMRLALAVLNEELVRTYGVAIQTRTGLNTGEVLVSDPSGEQNLVLGDAVNTAARLEQAAGPDEILLGASTYVLVRNAVVAERASPVAAKGKAEPVVAWRLLTVTPLASGRARNLDSPIVGRVHERAVLETSYGRAVTDQFCHVVTLVGAPGIGKSRLVTDFTDSVGSEATVLTGRCLSYGEGVTFWPVAEIVAQAAGVAVDDSLEVARTKLRSALAGDRHADVVAARVSELIALAPATAGTEESFWALRTFLEVLARRRPLVVVVDDLHWADPTLLDLLEHVMIGSRHAPILLVCATRPELFEVRPSWAGGGASNTTSVVLEPLAESEATELLANLLGEAALPDGLCALIAESAQGNPLFVEHMLAMLVEDGVLTRSNGSWKLTSSVEKVPVPPTIAALIAARLDRMNGEERSVLECASVVGQVFWRTAVAELAESALQAHVAKHLLTLLRRDLIGTDRSGFAGDDAFRFRHLLVRDAAYAALPKAVRADLHEAFTGWLERVAGERVGEYEAVLGYHLEQACRLRADLAPASVADLARARRGAEWLARSGRRSRDQGDDRSAAGLLARAAELHPSTGADAVLAELLLDLGRSLRGVGDLVGAEGVLSRAAVEAASAGSDALHGRALLEMMSGGPGTRQWIGALEELVLAWLPVFTQIGDHRALALAHHLRGWISANRGQHQDGCQSYESAWRHAVRAGDTRLAFDCLGTLRVAINVGPTPASESLRLLRSYAKAFDSRLHLTRIEEAEAWVLAMQGAIRESRALLAACRATYRELGLRLDEAYSVLTLYRVESAAGDSGAATESLLAAVQTLEDMGETIFLATVTGLLADALVDQGRDTDALHFSYRSEELADPGDVDAQVRWRRARGRALSQQGETAVAEGLLRDALDLVAITDALNDHADTLLDLAEVLRASHRHDQAVAAVAQAIGLYERKGNVAMAARSRSLL